MTVKELIVLLSKIENQDLPVKMHDFQSGRKSVDYAEVFSQNSHVGFKNEGTETWVELSNDPYR